MTRLLLILVPGLLLACAAQQQPTETAPVLPGSSDEERQAARFAQPESGAAAAEAGVAPPTENAQKAPGGTVLGLDGTPVDLAASYATRNVVLVFYRGGWCRFCRRQLGELQDRHKEMLRNGTDLYAVSTEAADLGAELSRKLGLEYPVLVDQQGQTARKWGVLDEQNGIARLSTFVVQRGGAIVYRHVATEAADYPPTPEVMEQVAALPSP
jgi:peroxiredoxin